MPETLVVIYDHDEEKHNFREFLQIPSGISSLYSLQIDDLEKHFKKVNITRVILINMNLRYDGVQDYLLQNGQPELIEFTIDTSTNGLEPFVPPYEETAYTRTYYKASPLTIRNFLKNEEERKIAIVNWCPSCGAPINSDGSGCPGH